MTKENILKILVDWNLWGNFKSESILRPKYVNHLERLVNTGEIAVVKGIRRSGKSTIILQLLKKLTEEGLSKNNTLIINLEDPRLIGLKLPDLERIYEVYLEELLPCDNQLVVLDEVQEVKGWEKFARYLLEAKKVKVIVSGFSSKLFSQEYASLLGGRHVDMEIFPLSFEEFAAFKNISIKTEVDRVKNRHLLQNTLKEYLEFGGLPKVALVPKEEKKAVLSSYFHDILVNDIQKRYSIRESHKLFQLATYYLTNISTLQSYNKAKDTVELSLDTVERFSAYFSLAELFGFVPKFSYSYKSQLLSTKKVYTMDLGLRRVAGFQFSEDWGRLMENAVWVELRRRQAEVYYGKLNTHKEVDFVVKEGQKVKNLIQVCYQLSTETRKREETALLQLAGDLKVDDLAIISFEAEGEEKKGRQVISYIPLWKWLFT